MATYMVRAMDQSDAEYAVFFEQNVVAVGWSEVNFSSYEDIEKLVGAVKTEYYSDGKTAFRWSGKS